MVPQFLSLFVVLISFFRVSTSFRFVVINDIYYDQNYTVGAPSNCTMSTAGMGCCRKWDTPIVPSIPAPEYGIDGCDTPLLLLKTIVDWIQYQDIDFVVFLGNAVDRDLFIQTPTHNMYAITQVADVLSTLNVPVYCILGDHDAPLIGNLNDDEMGAEWLYNISVLYRTVPEFQRGGYYTITSFGVKFIFLNCLGYDQRDPSKNKFNQTSWLTDQIHQAKINNQDVFIFTHFSWVDMDDEYNYLISHLNYPRITYFGSSFGHDSITKMPFGGIFYNNPGLSPDNHFPEMRIYDVGDDVGEGKVTNYHQYGFNLTSQKYEFVYSAKESYALNDLTPLSWTNFLNDTNATLRQRYTNHYYWGTLLW